MYSLKHMKKPNQIFHYTRCITPKRVDRTHLRVTAPRATQLLLKKYRSGSEPLATP